MEAYTFSQILAVIEAKGYCLNAAPTLPSWSGTGRVTMYPDEAQNLIEHNTMLSKKKRLTVENLTKSSSSLSGEVPEDKLEEVVLLPSYKIWTGKNIIDEISKGSAPVDVNLSVIEHPSFSVEATRDSICTEIRNAVRDIFQKSSHDFPEIPDEVWFEELPKGLTNLDITYISGIEGEGYEDDLVTLVGILSDVRSTGYPDNLYIIRGTKQQEIKAYPCNLTPSLIEESPVAIVPGMYEDLFAPTEDGRTLIQAKNVVLGYPVIENKRIITYEESPYTFMKVRIPCNKESNITSVGASFYYDVEQEFLNDLNISGIIGNSSFILLEEKDFF